ncbi:hypothetical protein [Methylomonas sp. AM2-LC]|uniref:hypothetical protein n=1 Tax=Methylomonas sp. AM2-LC TaxID=3153301 RepID=UPI003263FBC0
MLLVKADNDQNKTDCVDSRRSITTSHAMSLFSQPVIGVSLDKLLNEISLKHDWSEFSQNRSGIASVILLGYEMGCVTEKEINRSLGRYGENWRNILFLSRKVKKLIGQKVNDTISRYADDSWYISNEFKIQNTDNHHVSLTVESGSSFGESVEGFYIILQSAPYYSAFSTASINDQELSRVVYSCLQFISLGAWAITTNELGENWYSSIDEESESYFDLKSKYPNLSLESLAEIELNDESGFFTMYCGYENAADLVDRFNFLEKYEEKYNQFGELLELNDVRQRVIRWRRESRFDQYANRWVRFIRKAIVFWKNDVRSKKNNEIKMLSESQEEEDNIDDGYGLTNEINEAQIEPFDDVPWYMSHVIGFGLDWEESLVESTYQYMNDSGESPKGRMLLNSETAPLIAKTLNKIAVSKGLIRLAEYIEIYGV